jgi:hypothetical protein
MRETREPHRSKGNLVEFIILGSLLAIAVLIGLKLLGY